MFSDGGLGKFFEHFQEKADSKIKAILIRAGEDFVTIARENGSYTDITGNLRSSIGYAVVKDGNVVFGKVTPAEKGSDKDTGMREARRLMETLSHEHNTGWVLIGVAGMDYALFVETVSSRDVISSGYIATKRHLRQTIKKALEKIDNG